MLFVTTTGDDRADCTRAAPCRTIARAVTDLSARRSTIALAAGAYPDEFRISVPALVSGPSTDPTAVMLSSSTHDSIIASLGTAEIFVEGVSIGGNTLKTAAQAVSVSDGATVTFDRVIVRDNPSTTGVFVASGARFIATRFEAFGNADGMLASQASTIDIDRSYFHDHDQSAAASAIAAAGTYHIVNTIFTNNNIGFSAFGDASTGTLDFLTFATHRGSRTDRAISSIHPLSCSNSIFFHDPGALQEVAITFSMFSDLSPGGTGNFQGEPRFVDEAAGDYHIGGTSDAIDRADPRSTLAHDFDGNARPTGGARDIGADER